MATLYQKVRQRLSQEGPITYPNLADLLDADEEAVRLALCELLRRGKAAVDGNRISNQRGCLWRAR